MDIPGLYQIFLNHPDVCTDTRNIRPGSIFFALKGAHFDGNLFAIEALKLGAAYAVVSDRELKHDAFIYFDDTLLALQNLATYHRRQYHIPFIAITGSNGKTTTKEMISAVLAKKYKVHATAGNFNNHIGVPLTILGITSTIEIAIIEMGANHIGEIKRLCEIAMPTHGLITNIGKAHLEGFGSIEGVQQAKGELFEYLQHHNGHAFVNIDDPRLARLGKNVKSKTTYGFTESENPSLHFRRITNRDNDGFSIEDNTRDVRINSSMFGIYNATNMLAAYCVGLYFEVPKQMMVECLSSFVPGANRSEMVAYRGCTIIKDAYNANQSSMELALLAFAERYPRGWVVLGDMKELGKESKTAHENIIEMASSLGLSHIMLVGDEFKSAYLGMPQRKNIKVTSTIEELKKEWSWEQLEGCVIMIKGSRSMHLEKLIDD